MGFRTATRKRVLTPAALIVMVTTLATAGPTPAVPTSVTVASGVLGVEAPAVNRFTVVTLDGKAQVAEARLESFAVTDARGTGQGWALSLRATPFREWDGSAYVEAGKTLPEGSLTLPGLSVTAEDADSAMPQVVPGPYSLDGAAVKVAGAGADAGLGRFTFGPTEALRVAVPASAYARTYRSELSVSVTSGP